MPRRFVLSHPLRDQALSILAQHPGGLLAPELSEAVAPALQVDISTTARRRQFRLVVNYHIRLLSREGYVKLERDFRSRGFRIYMARQGPVP